MKEDGDGEADRLRRACTGDAAAFRGIYESHRRTVFRFAFRMLGSSPLAEDVAHECFLVLLTHPGRFDPSRASLRTFLCAVARNLSFKQLRKRGIETATDDLEDAAEPARGGSPEPLQQVLDAELSGAVQQAVADLPPLQREVLILFEYEGQSLAEIAAVVEADIGTVKARLHRARQRLRKRLSPWLAASEAAPVKRTVETRI